jgi:pilus assembly protein CpaE
MRPEPVRTWEAPDLGRGAPASAGRPRFLAFLGDEGSEAALRGGLADILGNAMAIRRGNVRDAAVALEREPTPHVLVVDITEMADPITALEKLASVCTPDVRVLAVGERSDIGFYRQLTRDLCIAEYIAKPLTRDSVSRLFAPHLLGGEAEAASRGGHVVAVCGVRGGVGASTIAVNLALQLAETGHGHVALLDMHLRGGTCGLLLGLRPGAGLRVVLEEPERADGLFLERVAIPVQDRVQLIAAEEGLETLPEPTEEGVRRLLELLQHRFNQVVIDLPMPPGPAERIVLAAARHIALVMGPDVAGVRDAVAARKLVGPGAASRVMTVLNRAGQPGTLKPKLVEDGLGAAPDVIIPDLPTQVPRAGNLGKPALHESAALRRVLAPLTQEIAAVRGDQATEPSLLARVLKGWRR